MLSAGGASVHTSAALLRAAAVAGGAGAASTELAGVGALRLVQALPAALHQPVRGVAQPARQEQLEPGACEEPQQPISGAAAFLRACHAPHMEPPQQVQSSLRPVQEQQPQLPLAAAAAAAQQAQQQQAQQQQAQQQQVQQQHAEQQAPQLPQQQYYSPPSGVKKTFYKRKLPCPPATEFSSPDGRLLFAEALQAGTMTGFFKLIEQYSTQDEPAFCGLASIAMVLNALSIDPKRPWKGSWRWFHEQLLDCCLPLPTVALEGVVLTQAACLAKCNGANVTLHRSGTFSLDDFRREVLECTRSGEEHLVVSYTRKAFGQTGDGHFSPVGGYHQGRDLVLILDTARFKYPPHWVPLPMLYDAMAALDPTTGQPRGYLRLSANTAPDSVLFTLDIRPDGSWRAAEEFIQTTAPQLVQAAAAAGTASPDALLARLVALAPLGSVPCFIAMRFAAHSCARDRCVPHTVRQQVLNELRATPLHQALQPLLARHLAQQAAHAEAEQQPAHAEQQQAQQQQDAYLSEKLTMLLLLQEPTAWGPVSAWADAGQHKAWSALLDASAVSIVEGEVGYLRQQLLHIERLLSSSSEPAMLQGGASAAAGGGSCGSCSAGPDAATAAGAAAAPAAAAAAAAPFVSPCSSCDFQDACNLAGCLQGELAAAAAVAGSQGELPAADARDATGCCGGGAHAAG